ncbi:MAG: 50S ribosomal protein L3 [Spirochaetes bacterium]|nr:50S ribosomal protein L3 [Spirochaetota bacterium]
MKLGLYGEKIGMTQVFDEEGNLSPATVIKTYPGIVIQIKSKEKDGYNAVRLAFKEVKKDKLNKPEAGLFLINKLKPHKFIREFRTEAVNDLKVGDVLSVQQFKQGDFIDIQGVSKGKGFQGVVKIFNFQGGPKTRGQSDRWRAAGSIGAGTDPGRVWKGHPMPRRQGHDTKTIQHLKIISINADKNYLFVKGAVPGPRSSLVRIRPSIKKELIRKKK